MLGGCIHQFFHQGSSILIDQVGWNLLLLQVSNAMYIRCRSSQRYKLGEFCFSYQCHIPLTTFLRSLFFYHHHLYGRECGSFCCIYPRGVFAEVNPIILEDIPKIKQTVPTGCRRPAILSPLLFAMPWLGTGARVSCRLRSLWRGCGHNASA